MRLTDDDREMQVIAPFRLALGNDQPLKNGRGVLTGKLRAKIESDFLCVVPVKQGDAAEMAIHRFFKSTCIQSCPLPDKILLRQCIQCIDRSGNRDPFLIGPALVGPEFYFEESFAASLVNAFPDLEAVALSIVVMKIKTQVRGVEVMGAVTGDAGTVYPENGISGPATFQYAGKRSQREDEFLIHAVQQQGPFIQGIK